MKFTSPRKGAFEEKDESEEIEKLDDSSLSSNSSISSSYHYKDRTR